MSGLLPQIFFVSILITALALMGKGAIDTNARLYTSQVLQATSALDSVRDAVEVESVTPGPSPEDITIALRNNGRHDITDWSAIDIIATYQTSMGVVTEALVYTEGVVTPGTWAPLASDSFEPGILNMDEQVQLRAYLGHTPLSGSDGRLILTMKNGATFSLAVAF